jgi:hypothetical protein
MRYFSEGEFFLSEECEFFLKISLYELLSFFRFAFIYFRVYLIFWEYSDWGFEVRDFEGYLGWEMGVERGRFSIFR